MHTKGNCSQQLAEGYWPCKLLAEGVVKKMVAFLALSMSVPTLATTYAVTPSSNAAAAQRRTLVDAYLRANGTTMVKGGTMRVTAYGAWDGSVSLTARCGGKRGDCLEHQQSCAGPGEQRRRSHGGGYGTVNVEAVIGNLKASAWTLTISAPRVAPARSATTSHAAMAPAAANPNPSAVVPTDTNPAVPSPEPAVAEPAVAEPLLENPQLPNLLLQHRDCRTPPGPEPAAPEPAAPAPDAPAPAAPVPNGPGPAGPVPAAPGPALPDGFAGPFMEVANLGRRVGFDFQLSSFYRCSRRRQPRPAASVQSGRACRAGNRQSGFDVAVKIDSPLVAADGDTSQGLMVLADNETSSPLPYTDGTKSV